MKPAFDPATKGYILRRDFDRMAAEKLLDELEDVDADLARHLREELFGGGPPAVSRESFDRLCELSPTNGTYTTEEELARSLGELLFGRPLAK
jgi:hypothetical protein